MTRYQPIPSHLVVAEVRDVTGEDYLLPYHHRLVSQLLGESGRKLEMAFGGGGGGCSLGAGSGRLRRQACANLYYE